MYYGEDDVSRGTCELALMGSVCPLRVIFKGLNKIKKNVFDVSVAASSHFHLPVQQPEHTSYIKVIQHSGHFFFISFREFFRK